MDEWCRNQEPPLTVSPSDKKSACDPNKAAAAMIVEADTNGDGKADASELQQFLKEQLKIKNNETVGNAILNPDPEKGADKNGDGLISPEELQQSIQKANDAANCKKK